MSDPCLILALLVSRILTFATRKTGHGGTSLPGLYARKLCPGFLSRLSRALPFGVLVVTGTNGKTSTCRMLARTLSDAGMAPIHNAAGANLMAGIATAFAQETSLLGKPQKQAALLETDEATLPSLLSEVQPRLIVVTNFFRDQLDRYGELDKTVSFVKEGLQRLPHDAWAILNADDPFVAALGIGLSCRVLTYGLETKAFGSARQEQSAESRYCRFCGAPLEYDWHYFGQLGHYRCQSCGFERPHPDVRLLSLEPFGDSAYTIEVALPSSKKPLTFRLPSIAFYDVDNALACLAAAMALDIPEEKVRLSLESYRPTFGRMERIDLGQGRSAVLALVKNPTGCDVVIKTLLERKGKKRLLALLNDNAADGRDVSWIWDADFEALTREAWDGVWASGLRAEDMALRLYYAGFDPKSIVLERDISKALTRASSDLEAGETLYVLPTYTALLEVTKALAQSGYRVPFWEEGKAS